MRTIRFLSVIACASTLLAETQHGWTQGPPDNKRPEVIEFELSRFIAPSEQETKQVEEWLLELELVPMVADRVACTTTGTYFFAGKGKEKHITNLRQFAIGWSLDNREDRERLLVINQPLLNPNVVDQGKWRLMQSDTSSLDRLRIKSLYHEANGSSAYAPSPKSQIQGSLESANTFFPTRAATSSPISCWSGQAMDRSQPMVTIEKLQGIQKVGKHTVALFEFRPADFYVFFVGLAFLDGCPVQCDGWRQFRREADKSVSDPTPEQLKAEREYLKSNAQRVARVQSRWRKLETTAVPVWIHGTTLNDFYDVELEAEVQWFVNEQVNPKAFETESLQQLNPFAVARE